MSRLQMFVNYAGPPLPLPLTGFEQMVDFEDIGGVYEDTNADVMTNNVAVLNAFFADENAPAIVFGGIRTTGKYSNARVAARAYLSGEVIIPAGKPVTVMGANTRLSFSGISGTTPAIRMESGASSVRRMIRDMDIDSTGSCIRLVTPGRGTIIENINVNHPSGLGTPSTGSGTVNLDDFTDGTTAAYGFKIEDSDGLWMNACSVITPADYGILVTGRLQAAYINARVWGSQNASGFKGENLNGTQLCLNCESCYDRGVWVERCGMGNYNGTTTHITNDRTNVWEWWTEANKGRGNTVSGYQVRQNRIEKCGAFVLGGYTGWSSNKVEVDEVSRNNGKLIQSVRVPQSINPMYDLNQEDPASPTFTLPNQTTDAKNNNFSTNWTVGEVGVTITGTQGSTKLQLSFPGNSFAGISPPGGTAYWRPWGLLTNFTPLVGDGYWYEMEFSLDPTGQQWCLDNDLVNSTVCTTAIAPYPTAGANPLGIYNGQNRKIIGRVSLDATGTNIYATPAFTWDAGTPPNASAFVLTVHSLKFYGMRASGGAIPQT